MFYCDSCREEKGWPAPFARSRGKCEVCGELADCYDVPSKYLPSNKDNDDLPDEIEKPQRFDFVYVNGEADMVPSEKGEFVRYKTIESGIWGRIAARAVKEREKMRIERDELRKAAEAELESYRLWADADAPDEPMSHQDIRDAIDHELEFRDRIIESWEDAAKLRDDGECPAEIEREFAELFDALITWMKVFGPWNDGDPHHVGEGGPLGNLYNAAVRYIQAVKAEP